MYMQKLGETYSKFTSTLNFSCSVSNIAMAYWAVFVSMLASLVTERYLDRNSLVGVSGVLSRRWGAILEWLEINSTKISKNNRGSQAISADYTSNAAQNRSTTSCTSTTLRSFMKHETMTKLQAQRKQHRSQQAQSCRHRVMDCWFSAFAQFAAIEMQLYSAANRKPVSQTEMRWARWHQLLGGLCRLYANSQ